MKKEIEMSLPELRNTIRRIINLIAEETGYDRRKISLWTSVNNDIGLAGDDCLSFGEI